MVIRLISKALKRDKNQLIIKKTDDEVTRYLKHQHIQSERKRFEMVLEDDQRKKDEGLNVEEKKELYKLKLDRLNYDRTSLNDQTSFDNITNKKNFNVLGKFWFTKP